MPILHFIKGLAMTPNWQLLKSWTNVMSVIVLYRTSVSFICIIVIFLYSLILFAFI